MAICAKRSSGFQNMEFITYNRALINEINGARRIWDRRQNEVLPDFLVKEESEVNTRAAC